MFSATDTIMMFARYNAYSNNEMNKIISQLTPEEWEKELGGYYKSVKALCIHIFLSDFLWLKRMEKIRKFKYLDMPVMKENHSWHSVPFNSVEEYKVLRDNLDNVFSKLADEVNEDDLEKDLNYINIKGEPLSWKFGTLIFHVFNHQTHNRGLTSIYLELLNKPNDYNSLMASL